MTIQKQNGRRAYLLLQHSNTPLLRWTKAFTLIELLVVVAIIAILASMLLPSLQKARESGKSAACLNNLRQLMLSVLSYTGDYGGAIPPSRDGFTGLAGWNALPSLGYYSPGTDLLSCPSDRTTVAGTDYFAYSFTFDSGGRSHNRSYLWTYNSGYRYANGVFLYPFWNLSQLKRTDRDLLLWCSDWPPLAVAYTEAFYLGDWTYTILNPIYPPLHGNAWNAAFMDGHVQRLSAKQYGTQIYGQADWE